MGSHSKTPTAGPQNSISWFSLVFGRFGSCKRYNWLFDEFILNLVKLGNNLFRDWYVNRVSGIEFNNAASLLEILFIRNGQISFNFLTLILL